jgi:hypothetical protein
LATELEIYGDVKLRDALREDEERIAKYLIAIMNSESDRAAVLRLEGNIFSMLFKTLGVFHRLVFHRLIFGIRRSTEDSFPRGNTTQRLDD